MPTDWYGMTQADIQRGQLEVNHYAATGEIISIEQQVQSYQMKEMGRAYLYAGAAVEAPVLAISATYMATASVPALTTAGRASLPYV